MNHPLLVPGHGIVERGHAHDDAGVLKPAPYGAPVRGRGRCVCGELSPSLPSTLARQRWHRDHRERLAGVPWL